jgi:hypothetical protein
LHLRGIQESLYDLQGNYVVNLIYNTQLRDLYFYEDTSKLPDFINLKNGANEKLERIYLDVFYGPNYDRNICIQADLPNYVSGLIVTGLEIINVNVSNDCGYSF